jgi:mannose-6-phosphate isomerase-like protein (cupin superfamily)
VTAYRPSPRPTFDGPAAIPYASVTRHIWGDPEAGEVADWIYASTERVHALVFGLAPGAWFRHSPEFRTIFGADELLYVLRGTMVIANPETGEVLRVPRGGSAFFRADTWHHEHLTAGVLELNPGEASLAHSHGGDEVVYAVEGVLHVRAFGPEGTSVFELAPDDAAYIPQGVAHEYRNYGSEPLRALFGVAPAYLP